MNKPASTLLRALGILVGLLFVATAPMIARDKGLSSFEGIGHLLVTVPMGLAFIAYGVKGTAGFVTLSPRFRLLADLFLAALTMALGMYLVVAPNRGVPSRVTGSLLLVLGAGSVWAAYVTRRSPPAA